jgi:hypothetical protein
MPDAVDDLGPFLDSHADIARAVAEVWLLTEEADRRDTKDSPSVVSAFTRNGAGFTAGDGSALIAIRSHTPPGFAIRTSQREDSTIGTVTPLFIPATSHGQEISVSWQPARDGAVLPTEPGWHAAVRAVAAVTAKADGLAVLRDLEAELAAAVAARDQVRAAAVRTKLIEHAEAALAQSTAYLEAVRRALAQTHQ